MNSSNNSSGEFSKTHSSSNSFEEQLNLKNKMKAKIPNNNAPSNNINGLNKTNSSTSQFNHLQPVSPMIS